MKNTTHKFYDNCAVLFSVKKKKNFTVHEYLELFQGFFDILDI